MTREANDRYFQQMLARRGNQIVWRDSCVLANSYYFDQHGDVPFRPSPTLEVARRSARFHLDDYRFEQTPSTAAAAGVGLTFACARIGSASPYDGSSAGSRCALDRLP